MGNKLSCSCGPLIRKAYRYDDSPWQTSRRRDGHLLRLWAEVFHVSASGAGTVKWQQVSEDLVPVNITCIQDSPECVFHITAYNSQVDKILDVRLVQPGTRIGQASDCFIYWKDPMTNDTWGLNFTSAIEAKQFRDCVSPSFKFSRKASSSYSLKLEPLNKKQFKTKRKPLSTPASPSRAREPQCTCMTAEQYARLRAQDPRYRGSSTLPRAQTRATDTEARTDKVTAATSSTSLYDNVGQTQVTSSAATQETKSAQREQSTQRQTRDRATQQQSQETSTMTSNTATGPKTVTASVGTQNNITSQVSQTESQSQTQTTESSKSEGTQAGGTLQSSTKNTSTSTRPPSLRDHHILTNTKSVDYSDMDMVRDAEMRAAHHHNILNAGIGGRRSKSKSTEDMNRENGMSLDSNTLKRMLKPMPSVESPVTSPEMGRRRYNYYNAHHHRHGNGRHSEPENAPHPHPRSAMAQSSRFSGSRSSHEIGRGYPGRGLYLELERGAGGDFSPPSDNVLFDNQCYATTPSSSNGNSDPEQSSHYHGRQRHLHHQQNSNATPTPGSPTSRLLLEYEMHLRNTLAKGMDAESYSLHTFEALLTQSMENLEFAESLPGSNQRSPYPTRRRPASSASINKSLTLPHRLSSSRDKDIRDRDRDGYYSDRNELIREREKERGYLSDHNSSFSSRCASCIGESSRAQWFRHSDGWRSGSSNYSSVQGVPQGHKRSPWDSLPSLRQDSSMNDSGYKSNRTDSFEQRNIFDRQDSLKSDYMSDRDSTRYGIVQQASIESADSRLCYLTSSEAATMVETNSKCNRRSVCNGTSPEKASLMSKRRRHKTVHFGDNLLLQVCTNANLQSHMSYHKLEPNVQQLFSFIESVLSAWVAEEGLTSQGEVSETDEKTLQRKRYKKQLAKLKRLDIRRLATEVSKLDGTRFLGNLRYRHMHWKGNPDAEGCNELFLRKISDDDRMSLTTAISDEDDGESVMNSPYKAKQTGTAAASFNCTGAVRKAGFLSVKKWLLRKKHQIELARKRGWKGYWVCLKGTTLLFYPCDSREGRSVEAAPKHLIIVDGAIMQPIPEHPKRDYIFCLSTAFGDAYLFQAPCQVELENWVNSIHSACAAAFARHRGKTGTLHLLQEEIFRLEKAIETDYKLKHMAEMQQSVVGDSDTRQQIAGQVVQWEENLERLHCEQFRLRCYMASLQSGELPNPKSLLTHVSRATKNTLNKLGVFTVSSFHAFICARSPSLLNNLLAGRGATKRRPPMLSRSNSGSSRRSLQMNSREESEKTVKVALPDNVTATVYVREAMSVEEFLTSACSRKSLNPTEHFTRVKKRRDMEDHNYFVPHRSDLIETYLHTHEIVEVCAKILYQVELSRNTLEQMWGFSVEAELVENADRQDELCCYVSRVEDKSVAMQNGIIKGDEIMVINGAIVSDLDMMYLESVLQEELALCMMMRSSRTEPPDLAGILRATDDIIDSLVCPPPPSEPPVISEEMISGLIVPAPGKDRYTSEPENPITIASDAPSSLVKVSSRTNSFEIENLLKTAEQVTGFCRSPAETRKSSPTGSVISNTSQALLTPSRQLSDAEKLRKVILELVDTERAYVKHLNNLLENYLEPLKKETFLSNAEINALFGNIQEIVAFQRQFLQNLEEALELEPDFHKFEHPGQFKNALFSIGSAFLYYVNHFKLYSSFCASHSKAQKVLHPNEGNQALQEFLAARNPRQQHSSTLESYLIKPIQRILKYPLLLQQLRNLTDSNCDEHMHLVEALKGMEKVAEHINEMQRIHEEYGAIFDHLFRQHQKSCKQSIDLSPGDLLYYGGVEWLNISDFLGKIKKGLELHAMCFVFKSAVVFLCKERLRQKKKLMGVSSKSSASEVEIIRYQVLIPVTEVQVRASSAKDMDSHFLWELIHLRSQLQRRSEKVYVLSNSTADFRNAFLKTIRQIIRESVRNMSIPATKPGSGPGILLVTGHKMDGMNSQTLERPAPKPIIIQGSHTLGKTKKSKSSQRHSAGNIDYDNISQEHEDVPTTFRSRSKTLGDAADAPKRHDQEKPDPGIKSEGEEDSQAGQVVPKAKSGLGKTPNHLTLSTTSTLSAGSTGSQARLIQASNQPENYHPIQVEDLGSPVWKPRDSSLEASSTFPRKARDTGLSSSRKSLIDTSSGLEIHNSFNP